MGCGVSCDLGASGGRVKIPTRRLELRYKLEQELRSGTQAAETDLERACACRAIRTRVSVEGGMRDPSNLPLTVNFSEGLPPASKKSERHWCVGEGSRARFQFLTPRRHRHFRHLLEGIDRQEGRTSQGV